MQPAEMMEVPSLENHLRNQAELWEARCHALLAMIDTVISERTEAEDARRDAEAAHALSVLDLFIARG